jgi:hypothetical protein
MVKQNEPCSLDLVTQAFNDHLLIVVRKVNGQVFGPGHIVIMYGEIAFRMKLCDTNDSFFIRIEEIEEILFPIIDHNKFDGND